MEVLIFRRNRSVESIFLIDMKEQKDGVLMRKIWLRIISGKKKNIALMLGGIIVMIGLSGCHYKSRGEYMADAVRKDYEQADMMMQSIMETLEAQDANALKELFSPYALKHTENLEEKIEELIEFYPGSDEGFEGGLFSKRRATLWRVDNKWYLYSNE